ncbi:MAG: hypothetical protein KJO07_19990 [Deltaproteobacteria bacterium]|nr:hypothetical protein [Deltaproteobacteria bacterium]
MLHGTEQDESSSIDEEQETPKKLICVRCHHPITSHNARIEVAGRHEHRRSNPHGYHFRVGCFAEAPGCKLRGQESSHFSWFPGNAWQVTVCGLCEAHNGWRFTGEAGEFYALVLDQLREGD